MRFPRSADSYGVLLTIPQRAVPVLAASIQLCYLLAGIVAAALNVTQDADEPPSYHPDDSSLVLADRPSYSTTVMVPSCACSSVLPMEARTSPSMV